MLFINDYAKMTLEELVSEEKKLNSQKTMTAFLIGMLVAVAVYSATHKGFILPIILLTFSYRIGYSGSQNLKNIQAEINRRDTDK